MSYKWQKNDLTVVSQFLREENGDSERVMKRLLSLNATLEKDDITKAIEVVTMQQLFDQGQISLDELQTCQTTFFGKVR